MILTLIQSTAVLAQSVIERVGDSPLGSAVFSVTQSKRDEPIANAWSAAESGRAGFAAGGVGSARCKLSSIAD